jgi:hypothetical protein
MINSLVCLSGFVMLSCRDQAGFESAFVMNVDDDTMGYVQFSTPEAAAAARKVRLHVLHHWVPFISFHSVTSTGTCAGSVLS